MTWPKAWPGVGQDSSAEMSHGLPPDPVEFALADALQRASVAGSPAMSTLPALADPSRAKW